MKKLFISLALLLCIAQAGAQTKSAADALKVLEKAKADAENPKKGASPATWVKLSSAYLDCYDAPIKTLWQNASQLEVKMLLKDQKILSSEQKEVGGKMFNVDSYEDKDLYYDENGALAAWVIKQPTLKESDALAEAYQALLKAQELDAKNAQGKAITEQLQGLQNRYVNEAMNYYTLGDNKSAADNFESVLEISSNPLLNTVDTAVIYYTAYTAALSGDSERAIKYFSKSIEIGNDQNGDVYSPLAESYKQAGDTLKAKEILAEGFTKYPTNQGILVSLINLYLESKDDPSKVLSLIKVAQQNEPTNASLIYAEGNVYKNLGKFDEAIAAYKKAEEVDPNYLFAPFSLGATYYEQAFELQQQAAQEMDDAKYAELNNKLEECLEAAIVPLEKAFTLTEDKDIRMAVAEYLKNVYFRFREKNADYKAGYDKYVKYIEDNKQ